MAVLLLVHTPPNCALVRVVVAEGQTVAVPVIVPPLGTTFTVTAAVAASIEPHTLIAVSV
jgi:hypothetical protein